MSTAAAIIIGNEILSGKFTDENGPWLAKRLSAIGVDLVRMVVIPDDTDVIAKTVRECSGLADHVFTSGGVGPTHDDVTFEGVAQAFDLPIQRSPEMAAAIRQRMGDSLTAEALKMADIPAETTLLGDGLPVFLCRNVVILPGVPRYFRQKFDQFADRLVGVPKHQERLGVNARETQIAAILNDAAERWPGVEIGSYPRVGNESPNVIITMESRDREAVKSAYTWLSEALPNAS